MPSSFVVGTLICAPSAEQVAVEASRRMAMHIREALERRGACAVALSGGSSPVPAYERLAREPLDWARVHVFWVDERAVSPESERSNFGHAKRALLDPARIPEGNVHRMTGEAADLEGAARAYERTLRAHVPLRADGIPELDLAVLGVGDDGHVASLFPGEPTVHVLDRLVAAVAETRVHEARLTLTAPILEASRASVFVARGQAKLPALLRVWSEQGSLDETPARIVRSFAGAVTWITDDEAAGLQAS